MHNRKHKMKRRALLRTRTQNINKIKNRFKEEAAAHERLASNLVLIVIYLLKLSKWTLHRRPMRSPVCMILPTIKIEKKQIHRHESAVVLHTWTLYIDFNDLSFVVSSHHQSFWWKSLASCLCCGVRGPKEKIFVCF